VKYLRSTSGPSVDAEWGAYEKYLQTIKDRIPPSLADFAQVNSHDARIIQILRPKKHCVSITLTGFAYEELKSLTFTVDEVVKEFAPDKLIGQALWRHEVTLSDSDSFEIRAKAEMNELFICGKSFTMKTEPFAGPNRSPAAGSR
jgi:hypothetical protein